MPFLHLTAESYSVVCTLLTGPESSFSPSPLSILEGTIEGDVFANSADEPTCAAVMSKNLVGGRLVGLADDESFNQGFVSFMKGRLSSAGAGYPVFWSGVSDTWDEVVFRIFGYRVFRIDRTQFQFNNRAFEVLAPLPPPSGRSLTIRRIDERLLDEHVELRNQLAGLWGSVANFLKLGGGWVAISEDDSIVGRCNAAFFGGNSSEVAIWTDKSFRGMGLASHLCQKFIEDCLERKVIPNWTCDTLNKASYNMAVKLGFEPAQSYSMYTSTYAPMDHEPARES